MAGMWEGVMGDDASLQTKWDNQAKLYAEEEREARADDAARVKNASPQTSSKKVEGTQQTDKSPQPVSTLTYPETLNSIPNTNCIVFEIVGIADIGVEFTGIQRSNGAFDRPTVDVTKNASSNASKDSLTSLTNPDPMQPNMSVMYGKGGYVPLSAFDGRNATSPIIQDKLASLKPNDLHLKSDMKPIGTIIKLPMPAEGLNTTYGVEYADVSLGLGGALVNAVTSGAAFSEMAGGSLSAVIRAIGGYSAGALDTYMKGAPVNVSGSTEALTRTVQNPRKEMLFKGVNYRKFGYTFTLAANNASECSTILAIIKLFKYHMMPTIVLGSFYMSYPSEFNISYHYNEGVNPFLHNIGACALETMTVAYGKGNWSTLQNGAPTIVQMKCDFLELEPLSRNRAQANDL